MSNFKIICYDKDNKIIENNLLNNTDFLHNYKLNEYLRIPNNEIFQEKFNVFIKQEIKHNKFNNMNFIEKVCYCLNKLTYYYDNSDIIYKIEFINNNDKFIINKISSNKIYNIIYIKNDIEIFNNNIFLFNNLNIFCDSYSCCAFSFIKEFHDNFNSKSFIIKIPLGDYVYDLLENNLKNKLFDINKE